MDAFVLARLQARQKRTQVPQGLLSGYAVIEWAFNQAGFEIHLDAPGSTLLGKSDAKLYRDFSAVYVRNDVSQAEQALHLAHEYGHLCLHKPNEECELHETDLKPAGSRALARVEAYGPRERRELVANVFGREFLLPRDLARKLFIEDRLSATTISGDLKLPAAMVRQQLFDALLQDEVVPKEKPKPKPQDFDCSQKEAIQYDGRALLVEAGPGSGKTKTLVGRIGHLLEKTHPSQILALTFSNKAAGELSSRVVDAKGDAAVEVWTGTFHAFGLEVLRRHYNRLGLDPKIRLLSPSQAVEMLEEQLPLLGLKHFHDLRDPGAKLKELLRPIFRAKDELIGPAEFRRLATVQLDGAQRAYDSLPKKRKDDLKPIEIAEKTLEAATVYDVYDRLLRESRLVDFADLVMMPTLLMRDDEDVRNELRDRHREILVDEYQDVNRASAEMVKLFWGVDNNVWVVGDARQSIYRFRGASPMNMDRFETDFPGGERKSLAFNYRSPDHITGLCRTFAKVTDEYKARRGESHKGLPYTAEAVRTEPGSKTKLFIGQDDDCESDLVAEEIRRLVAAGVAFGEQTVLARTNTRLDTLATRLSQHGIPVLHLGSFFEREEVRDILSILALVSEPNGAALARVAAFRGIDVGASDIAIAVAYARDAKRALAEVLPNARSISGLSVAGREALSGLGTRLRGLGPHSPAFEVVTSWLLDLGEYLRHLVLETGIQADLRRAAVRQLVEFLDQVEPNGSPLTAREALRRVRTVVLLADDRDLRDPGLDEGTDAVRLMTVHASKGLQFPAVHLVGLHEGGFPKGHKSDQCRAPIGIGDGRDPKKAQAEEERCGFFVAVSRAEDHLRLYHTRQAARESRAQSTFITDLGGFAETTFDGPAAVFSSPPRTVGGATLETITLQDIRDYDKCPLRAAYRYHLSIRSRRHESVFQQTSSVLYTIIDQISVIADASDGVGKALDDAFGRAWTERGPARENPLLAQYEAVGRQDLGRLQTLLAGHSGSGAEPTRLPIEGGFVIVPPPLVAGAVGNPKTARMVTTGKRDTKNARALTAGLFLAAARFRLDRPVEGEVAHIADGGVALISRSDAELANDLAQAAEVLDAIRAGRLDAKPNLQTCIRCGHFFSCPATGARLPI